MALSQPMRGRIAAAVQAGLDPKHGRKKGVPESGSPRAMTVVQPLSVVAMRQSARRSHSVYQLAR